MKNKNNILIFSFTIMGFFIMLMSICSKDDTNNSSDNSTTIKDFDGNVYHSVTIGTQTWLVENLKVTHYRNGNPIPNVTDDDTWQNLTSGAYCDYNNSPNISTTYGKLYNWYAVSDSRNIAPIGWHIATFEEWWTLYESINAGSLKESGTTHWNLPNEGASNTTGFTALPGGLRKTYYSNYYGQITNFAYLQDEGHWWTTSYLDDGRAEGLYMSSDNDYLYNEFNPQSDGMSIRCVKD